MIRLPLLALALGTMVSSAEAASPLRIGVDCTYPPFGYQDSDGQIKGFDVDVAKLVADRIGREALVLCQDWDGMIPALLAGKFDMISASMSITEERQKSIDFSVPYRSSSARFAGQEGLKAHPLNADGSIDPEGLDGLTVGIQRASTYAKFMTEKYPTVSVVEYDKVNDMILDLEAGRLDLVFAGPIKLDNDFLSKPEGKGFAFVGPEINDVSYFGPGIGLGLRKEDAALTEAVNNALTASFADGSFDAMSGKYWDFRVRPDGQ
ncbi:transporter substrate-binding domain-containing protein [Haematobacter missouriensis]|uniref:Solute-binding protein family 3/N-terminal domain-containing protein n=1 Tax=Haematobacter missouriensis TaxID=366616 RepID=A0A225D3R3_9RHOB|nr:transporter substrate-binding domain-containing protein [Haematobacter missouriensis]OWJ77790.1 hypothetical protein CDV53_04680 [Haematobacter missouriensis]OWJ81218.1 hypothetical protein CDV52_19165 [Haematobacter missouriensis]